jgi:hypothetical protein
LGSDCANGSPIIVQYLKNDDLLLVVNRKMRTVSSYTHGIDNHMVNRSLRSRTYGNYFEGFSFNLIDPKTGKVVNSACWYRPDVRTAEMGYAGTEDYNNQDNYYIFLTENNQIYVAFQPPRKSYDDKKQSLAYVARHQISNDTIYALPDLPLNNMIFRMDNFNKISGLENNELTLLNEFNEVRYLSMQTGEISENSARTEPSKKESKNVGTNPFVFSPKEMGSTRHELYYIHKDLIPPKKKQLYADEFTYERFFDGFITDRPYKSSEITQIAIRGIDRELEYLQVKTKPLPIKQLNTIDAALFIEPSLLYYSDINALFITRKDKGFLLHYADSEKIIWEKVLDAEFLNTREEVLHSEVLHYPADESSFFLFIKELKVARISYQTGEVLWTYQGGMPSI